jgi:hypothetical protein
MITTNEVFVHTKGAEPVMPIVRWLRERGLIQGIDFDFKYQPRDWNMQTYEAQAPGVSFFFKEEKWATFMRVKYGDDIQRI